VDGVRADGQPVRLICYYKFMLHVPPVTSYHL
jgi:hypothetical protein